MSTQQTRIMEQERLKSYLDKLYKKGYQDFLSNLQGVIVERRKMVLVTANPEILVLGMMNSRYHSILNSPNTTIVADGIGVVKGARLLGYPLAERIPGIEIAQSLLEVLDRRRGTLALVGAQKDVITKLLGKIGEQYPSLEVVYAENGYDFQINSTIEVLHELQPDVVLVALGAPKQEFFIAELETHLHKGILIGVGGAFDVLSGFKRRAPDIFIQLRLEWLYRILKEPKRFKRFVKGNLRYLRTLFALFIQIKSKKGAAS